MLVLVLVLVLVFIFVSLGRNTRCQFIHLHLISLLQEEVVLMCFSLQQLSLTKLRGLLLSNAPDAAVFGGHSGTTIYTSIIQTDTV